MKSCRRGYKVKNGRCVRIKNSLSSIQRKRKRFWLFIGSLSAIFLGSWMIFYLKNNWGFIPAIIGVCALIWGRK